jgi:hypothetical protein
MISPVQGSVNLFAPLTRWGAAPHRGRNRPRRNRLAARMSEGLATRERPPPPRSPGARPPPHVLQRPDAPDSDAFLYVGFAIR